MRLFISHSSKDNLLIRRITELLSKTPIEHYWVDFEKLHDDSEIRKEINEGISKATHFLLVWSKNSLESNWVREEIDAVYTEPYRSKIGKFILKMDDTPLRPLDNIHLYRSISKEDLEHNIIDIIENYSDDFDTQIKTYRRKVWQDYENLSSVKKPIISNFLKFDGGKYYVRQSYRNLTTNQTGHDISEYVLSLIYHNISRIELEKKILSDLQRYQVEIKQLGVSDTILEQIKKIENVEDFEDLCNDILENEKIDPEVIDRIDFEITHRNRIKSEQRRLSKLRSSKKLPARLELLKNRITELESKENRLLSPTFLRDATEEEITQRNITLREIAQEKEKSKKEIKDVEGKITLAKIETDSEEEILQSIESIKNELEALIPLTPAQLDQRTKALEIVRNLTDARKILKDISVSNEKIREEFSEKLIPVIGDYGSGKSALCHYLMSTLCKDEKQQRIPIFIPLGQLPKHDDQSDHLSDDIYQFIITEYKFNLTKFEFEKRIENGEFIFMLDALDEMSNKLDTVIAQNNLSHVIKLCRRNVIVLTSRHTYLSESMEQKLLFDYNGLIKILDFTKQEIEKYLHLYLGTNESRIDEIKKVIEGETIGELSQKPLFLYVIVNNFDNMKDYYPINESVILQMLTDAWIIHDVKNKRDMESSKKEQLKIERQSISEILAIAEYKSGKPIGIDDIKSEVKEALQYTTPEADKILDQYYKDAITSTFLIKEENEKFRFILNPVIEYFVARCIVNDIKNCKINTFLNHAQMIKSTETFDFIKGIIDNEWSIKHHVFKSLSPTDPEYTTLQSFENKSKFVFDVINDIRNKGTKQKVGNLIKILHLSGNLPHRPNLSDLNISQTHIPNANLSGSNLRKANLRESILRGSDLSQARLIEANLYKTKLNGADLREADLTGADLREADLTGADLREADLTGANLTGAILAYCDIRNAILTDTMLNNVHLVGANIAGLDLTTAKLVNADCSRVDFQDVKLGTEMVGIKLTDCKLNTAKFSKANLTAADFRNADLSNAFCNESILRGADLRWAKLVHTDLFRADLSAAKLQESDLRGNNIGDAIIVGANLKGAENLPITEEEARKKGAII